MRFVAGGADKIINTAGEGHNEHNTCNADGDAEGGQESAAAILAEVI